MSTDTIFVFAMLVYGLMAVGTFLEFKRMGANTATKTSEPPAFEEQHAKKA
ncbi:MAG: hypothetical protein ACI9ON_004147 [Limisphaerales bacterium]|jgi:hypothetical protein